MRKKLLVATTLALALVAAALPWTAAPAAAAGGAWVDVAHHDGRTWALAADGRVVTAGSTPSYGDVAGMHLNGAPRAIVPTRTGNGYWIMGADGGVFTFGDARFHGSTGAMRLNAPVISMTRTHTGNGYWLLASDGGVFSFGDARFHGSTGAMRLNAPVVGMARTQSGSGYWLVASDGGIFSFGDARFHGSTGAMRLNSPVISMAAAPTGTGYWLLAADGGIFSFGAPFRGSAVGLGASASAITTTADGYLVLLDNGGVYRYPGGSVLIQPATGPHAFIARGPNGRPARWNPCRDIRIAVNYAGSGLHPGVRTTLPDAIDRIRAASGLPLQFVGETTATYPSANADVVISWTSLPGGVLGQAQMAWAQVGSQLEIRQGVVQFNGATPVNAGYGVQNSFGVLALHEIAHVLGLDHVNATTEVMYPVIQPLNGYGPGDREGLWHVGAAQGCTSAALSADAGPEATPVLTWTTIVD